MKKLLTALAVITLFAQMLSAQEKISGIGKFKIHKATISIISEIEKEIGESAEVVKETSDFYKKKRSSSNTIMRLEADSATKSPIIYAAYCADSKVYNIKQYEISGIKLRELYLFFYQDTLVRMQAECSYDLRTALETKYGEPETESKEADGLCGFHKDKTKADTWNNENIEAQITDMTIYDTDCKDLWIYSFGIYKAAENNAMENCDKAAQEKIQAKKNKEKLDKLKDF